MRFTGSHEQPSARAFAASHAPCPPPRWLQRRPMAAAKAQVRMTIPPAHRSTRVLFLDGRSEDVPAIISAAAGKLQIVLLDRQLNGVKQLAHHLQGRVLLDELLIAAADTTGTLSLGNTDLTVANLYAYEDDLRRIGSFVSATGRIRLLGRGQRADRGDGALLVMLGRMTGVAVEATTEPAHLAAGWSVPWREPEHPPAYFRGHVNGADDRLSRVA